MFFSGRSPRWQALRKVGLVVVAAGVLWVGAAQARRVGGNESADASTLSGSVLLSQLPPQAQATYRLIFSGGPFSSPKDGVMFGNRERALPSAPRGFYHEYTVPTPGARTRGARRIVCGGRPVTQPQVCYYTGDHYASFQRIGA